MTLTATFEAGPDAPAVKLPSSPEGFAIFLDVDGTLLDLADTPDGIVVPDGLSESLVALHVRLDGALALVSGRGLNYLRELFPDLPCAMAGLHGAEIAGSGGTDAAVPRSPTLEAAKREMREFAASLPGVIVEDKGAAFAAHFRQAPHSGAIVAERMAEIAAGLGDGVVMQRGKSVIEIRPAGHDKGTALRHLMDQPPFQGRRPIAVGDDLTDEAMFAAVAPLGGISVKVGSGDSIAALRLAGPSDVRAWIGGLIR